MKEKPILFSTPMVRAILTNNKTQTRRVKGLQFLNDNPDEWTFYETHISEHGKKFILLKNKKENIAVYSNSPYGQIGDRLWVRETFKVKDHDSFKIYLYKTDHLGFNNDDDLETRFMLDKWRPSIYMPRNASRITLEITNIRIERLLDISEQDAIAEGVENTVLHYDITVERKLGKHNTYQFYNPIPSFLSLWEKINGVNSLKQNPFVWVIGFKRIEK